MNSVVVHNAVGGRFKFVIRDGESLRVKRRTPWMKNMILDAGLNRLGTGSIADWCQVGTSSSGVSAGQTALVARIAATIDTNAYSQGANPTPVYYNWHRRVYRFAVGVAAGNISEVGVGWASSGSLWSRALTVNSGGVPTTITVLPTEVLDVVYELRVEMNVIDVPVSMMIGGIMRSCIVRPANVTAPVEPYVFGRGPYSGMVYAFGSVFTGGIAAVTAQPTGELGIPGATHSYLAYSNNSLQRVMRSVYPLSSSPVAIQSTLHTTNLGDFQISYSPSIVKGTTETLTLDFLASWSRL